MEPRRLLFIAFAFFIALGTCAQRVNRVDVCQRIPNLTTEQKQEIDKLRVPHQKKMDRLRDQFYAELDVAKASEIKTQMTAEMKDHYKNVNALLTPEQKTFFDQNCYANKNWRSYNGRGSGRNCRGYWRSGQQYGQGSGRAIRQGRGRGQGRGYGRWYVD